MNISEYRGKSKIDSPKELLTQGIIKHTERSMLHYIQYKRRWWFRSAKKMSCTDHQRLFLTTLLQFRRRLKLSFMCKKKRFEDTNDVIRRRKSKRIDITMAIRKGCLDRVRHSCSTSGIHLVLPAKKLMVSHEWGKGRVLIMTNASEYPCEIYRHDIAVILLKVALNTITLWQLTHTYMFIS